MVALVPEVLGYLDMSLGPLQGEHAGSSGATGSVLNNIELLQRENNTTMKRYSIRRH
jgi:hypothetical protein